MSLPPIAFLSYVRADDEHEQGRLSELCRRLAAEVRMQTGKPFEIFQDNKDIQWGHAWQDRIESGLDEATFLICIITPAYFEREWCRKEFLAFRGKERKLGRQDLILPIYYVEADQFSDEELRRSDEVARILAERQYADWRDLRFEPWSTPEVGKAFAKLATQIRSALKAVRSSKAPLPEAQRPTAPAPAKPAGKVPRSIRKSAGAPPTTPVATPRPASVEVVLERSGNANRIECQVDGRPLMWDGGTSVPMPVPPGRHVVQWTIHGTIGQKYNFRVVKPKNVTLSVTGELEADKESGAAAIEV